MATSWYTEADFPDERNGLSISGVTADTLAMVRSDMVSELVGLVAANAGGIPGYFVKLAVPIAKRAVVSLNQPSSTKDDSTAGLMLQMAKDAAKKGEEERSLNYLARAAKLGNVEAMYALGTVVSDEAPDEAKRLFEEASKRGSDDATLSLALLLSDEDPKRCEALLRQLHAKDHEWATVVLGEKLAAEGKEKEALEVLERVFVRFRLSLVTKGHGYALIRAYHQIGCLYEKRDPKLADHYLKLCIKFGYRPSMVRRARLIAQSKPREARELLMRAAREGSIWALYDLANMVKDTDPLGALELYLQVGETEPQYALAKILSLFSLRDFSSFFKSEVASCIRRAKEGEDVYLRTLDVLARGGRETNPEASKRLREYCDAASPKGRKA